MFNKTYECMFYHYVIPGTLSQVVGKGRRAQLHARQAFLFSNHLLLTTRATGGRLHLPPAGRLPLHDALLVEDPSNHDDDGMVLQSSLF